jgi:hypothetical protein
MYSKKAMSLKTVKEHNQREIKKAEKDAPSTVELLTEAEKLMPELRTLAYCTTKAVEHGYKENFQATKDGLKSIETSRQYTPEQIHVMNFYRFEGITDPADMSVLYVIRTDDGAKGTLVDAYGTYSDENISKVMRQVEDIAKRNTTSDNKQYKSTQS